LCFAVSHCITGSVLSLKIFSATVILYYIGFIIINFFVGVNFFL
jgi:hypothetical protein